MNNVYEYLKNLLKEKDIIVVACSGGPDSMCLLNILIDFRKNKNISIVCAHVNHNVRKESYKEMEYLENFSKKNDIIFEKMIIQKYNDDNFHNEARVIRYNFFEDIVNKYGANYLMTAHHGDDLIETVLMRIVRGSTLGGYAGFKKEFKKGNYKIIRPLISLTKDEISIYNKKNKVIFATDKSNFKEKYTRNRYRKYILPFLKREEKNVHEKFIKYSNTLFMYDEYINSKIEDKIKEVYSEEKIDIEKFKKLETIIQNKIIYYLLEEKYQDDLILVSDIHVELIKNLIDSKKANSYIYLPENIKVVKSYNELSFLKVTDEIDNYDMEFVDYAQLPNGKTIEKVEEADLNNNNYCRLSKEDVLLPLHIRTRKSGDNFVLKGLNGHKKVKDIFINEKIPIKDRDLWPIVVDSKDNIVWIPGIKKSKFDVPKNKKCDIILKYY